MIFDIIFGLKLESDSVPFRTVVTGQNQKLYLFLVFYAIMLFHWMQSLNYLGDKPFSTWHGAVYFFGAQKLISNPKGSLKGDLLSLYIVCCISCVIYLCCYSIYTWSIQENGQYLDKDLNNAFIKNFIFFLLRK